MTQAAPVQRLEDLAALPAYRAASVRQRANARRFAPFMLITGLGLVALGVQQSRTLLRLEAAGVRAAGIVSELRPSASSDGGTVYYPIVHYATGAGQTVRFKDNTGSSPPMYRVGQPVTVLYLPGVTGSAIIDRGPWNWLPAALMFGLGTLLLALSVRLLTRRDTQAVSAIA